MARACGRDANLPAVWVRHKELRLMARHGLLASWQHGTVLDEAVFHVAASVPMRGVCFDRGEFVKRLRGRDGNANPRLAPKNGANLGHQHSVCRVERARGVHGAVCSGLRIAPFENREGATGQPV
jgi:hypothetical protein